jgi:mRNA-capping enzyme
MNEIRDERALRIKQMKQLGLHQSKRPDSNIALKSNGSDKSIELYKPPHGWQGCPCQSAPLGFFIASKTPLSDKYGSYIEEDERYTPLDTIHHANKYGRKITLVIDLTNTSRYYDGAEFERLGISYAKIQCHGREGPPDALAVSEFVFTVKKHLSERGSVTEMKSGPTILVHCTHGFNRTGAMLVHYFQRTEPWPELNKHISMFSKSRPPGIYKPTYVKALFAYYLERRFSTTIDPKLPAWKHISKAPPLVEGEVSEIDLFGVRSASYMHSIKNESLDIPSRYTDKDFGTEYLDICGMDDVLGEEVCDAQAAEIRNLCLWSCLAETGSEFMLRRSNFPGSQPVSLTNSNVSLLKDIPYYVTWKADGMRYLLLLMRDGVYLIDRKFSVRRVQMRFPLPVSQGIKTHHATLLDGEMVIDRDSKSGKYIRRYLAYDCITLNSEKIGHIPFKKRLDCISSHIIDPRTFFFSEAGPKKSYQIDRELFSIRLKQFYPLAQTKELLEKFIPSLCHESDGLIFQPKNAPYVPNTYDELLKWKYPEMNTIDFALKLEREKSGKQIPVLYVGGIKGSLSKISDKFVSKSRRVEDLAGKIVECSWSMEEKCWKFLRIRSDKTTPNYVDVYKKTWQSIQDNITSDGILRYIC